MTYRVPPPEGSLSADEIRATMNTHLQTGKVIEPLSCTACHGLLGFMGSLGNHDHYRCINCGLDQSQKREPLPPACACGSHETLVNDYGYSCNTCGHITLND